VTSSNTASSPISVETICAQVDAIQKTAMELIERLQDERNKYREALERIARGSGWAEEYRQIAREALARE
jgi:hypothetical protein